MNNDLISRDTLKIEIEKQIAYCDDKSKRQSDMEEVLRYANTSYGLRLAHIYIDNAPTIYPICEDKACKYRANEKPQGEWIAREDMDYLDENKVVHNHFQCNKCGLIHDFIDGHTSQYNFCPNCGADMKRR